MMFIFCSYGEIRIKCVAELTEEPIKVMFSFSLKKQFKENVRSTYLTLIWKILKDYCILFAVFDTLDTK